MNEMIKPNEWRRFIAAAIIGFLLFAALDLIPTIVSTTSGELGGKVIEKAEAERLAASFAEQHLGMKVSESKAVHQTDKLMNGYLMKEELAKTYYEQYDSRFPTDTFQVEVSLEGKNYGFVYVHMQNGSVVAWNFNVDAHPMSDKEMSDSAAVFLEKQGFRSEELKNSKLRHDKVQGLIWSAAPAGFTIEEAKLNIDLALVELNGEPVIAMYKPAFQVPDAYKKYVDKQDMYASVLTMVGYLLMSIVLCILAIVYAILYRKFTSFKYGIILTIIYFIAYCITNLIMVDGVRASLGEIADMDLTIMITMIFTIVVGIPMAASIYISLVAGDGLWKAMGRNVWPRFKDAGYGEYVWRSARLGYLFALILFGLQAVIFLILKLSIGTWNTSDATQSPYNISALWLMPVLAWMAAIGEEAVFRMFGIGLFRKWFKNTFLACLPPTLFWALGHVMYPFYPATTRLFELIIIGLAFCYIFMKYGYITAVFTHAIFNTIAVSYSIIMVGSAFDIAAAVLFIVLPVLIAYVIRLLHNKKRQNPSVTTDPPLMQQ